MANKTQKPSIAELQDSSRYTLVAALEHDEMIPFVMRELKRSNPVIAFFYAFTISGFVAAIALAAWQIYTAQMRWTTWLGYFTLGNFLGSSLIIPLHEGLHGLGYWLDGARRIHFGGNWKKFYWYAAADEWVISSWRYVLVALLPFAATILFGLIALFYVPLHLQWLLIGVIWMHSLNCAGDFAVVGFCWEHRKKPLYTYDRLRTAQSFFYSETHV